MRIDEIFVESFGAYRHVSIRGLGPGLTVIVGPNEAGKTTLLEFVRSVFFGFKKRTGRTNIYETVDGVPRRGWIGVTTGHKGNLRISRNEQTGAREGLLSITDEKGAVLDESAVSLFQSGLKKSVYESLFAFDMDQLRRLDQEALRGRIMAAALGATRVNPLEVREQLDERARKLTRRSAKDPESLWAIQAHVKELDKKLRVLGEKPRRYSDLKDELAAVEVRRSDLSAEIAGKEATERQLAEILRFEQDWFKLVTLDREMEFLNHAAQFPANGVVRMDQCLERRRDAEQDVQELETSIVRLRNQLAELNEPTGILEHSSEIHSLVREAGTLAASPAHIERLKASIQYFTTDLTQEVAGLGESWDLERVRRFDLGLTLEQEIRRFVDLWRKSEDNIRNLQPRLMESSERCNRLRERIERNVAEIERISPLCKGFLNSDEREKLRRWREHRGKAQELGGAFAEKSRAMQELVNERTDIAARIRSLKAEPGSLISPIGFWMLVLLLVSIASGMLFFAFGSTGPLFYLSAVVGLVAAAAAPLIFTWKMRTERVHRSRIFLQLDGEKNRYAAANRHLTEIENERRLIRHRIQALSDGARNLAADVLGNSEATLEDVTRAESLASSAEEPSRTRKILEDGIRFDKSDLEAEEGRAREIERLVSAAETDFATTKHEWAAFSVREGFPQDVDPESALELVRRLRDLKKRLPRILEEENSLAEALREWESFSVRVRDLGVKLGEPMQGESSPLDRVEAWSRTERQGRDAVAERKALQERIDEHETRLDVARKKVEVVGDEILALMEAAAAENEESFRNRGELHERFRAVEREMRLVTDALVAGHGMANEVAMREHMLRQNWPGSRESLATLEADLKQMRHESEELATRSGMLMREIETLEGEDETDRLLLQKEELVARLKLSATEFIVTQLASKMLDETVGLYEQDKQPRVLERSSQLFRLITGNKYRRILFQLGGEGFKVERGDGQRLDEDLLSRGTLEQLYLSLRLAHLDVYHRDKTIPLLMDDVLVNFDSERAARTATALTKFSEDTGIQILFFTCHSHIANLFPEGVARMRLQPNSAGTGLRDTRQAGGYLI